MDFPDPVALARPLYFFRHGQTDWNREKRCQGLTDIPLNATGEAQARAYGARLRAVIGEADGFRLVASPLSRARRTLELICAELGLDPARIETDDRLVEVDQGQWNRRTYDEIFETWPDDWADYQADKWAWRRPGGEAYADRVGPVTAFLRDLAAAGAPAIVVGHGGSGRVLRAILAGHPPRQVVHLPMTQDQFYAFNGNGETIHRCDEEAV